MTNQLTDKSFEGQSFVFKRPDLLKDALQGPQQNYLRRMTRGHKIRDFHENAKETKTEQDELKVREFATMQEFICFYSSSESEEGEASREVVRE